MDTTGATHRRASSATATPAPISRSNSAAPGRTRAESGVVHGAAACVAATIAEQPALDGQLPPGLRDSAERGDAVAQNELGSRYYAGRGVEPNR